MDIYFAVFNGHINNANTRTMEEMEANHPEWAAEIKNIVAKEGGIMAIFDHEPTEATRYYAETVQRFVNE